MVGAPLVRRRIVAVFPYFEPLETCDIRLGSIRDACEISQDWSFVSGINWIGGVRSCITCRGPMELCSDRFAPGDFDNGIRNWLYEVRVAYQVVAVDVGDRSVGRGNPYAHTVALIDTVDRYGREDAPRVHE